MAMNIGSGHTDKSYDTLENKTISGLNNLLEALDIDVFDPAIIDQLLTSEPTAHTTLATAKAIWTELEKKLNISGDLGDILDPEAARDNLDVYSTGEVDQALIDQADIIESFGDISVVRDSQNYVESIITSMASGSIKTETINRNAAGDITSIQTTIPSLGINRTETIVRNAEGFVTGVTV